MKKIFAQIVMAALPMMASAQEFVVQGKEWFEVSNCVEDKAVVLNCEHHVYRIDGDTVIAGETWAKLYDTRYAPQQEGATRYMAALKEQDRKVQIVLAGTEEAKLLYDFGVQLGETLTVYPMEEFEMRADSVTTYVEWFGQKRQCIDFNVTKDGEPAPPTRWYGGIGTIESGFLGRYIFENNGKPRRSVVACRENGQRIYETLGTLLHEGKLWKMEYEDKTTGERHTRELQVKGDVVINGILAYNVWQRTDEGEWNHHSSMATLTDYVYDPYLCTVTEDGTTPLDSKIFKDDYVMPEASDTVATKANEELAQEINTVIYDLSGHSEADNDTLLSMTCYQDGQVMYQVRGNRVATGISAVRHEDKSTGIFDLQGRRLSALPQRGIYIVDGKKRLR